MVKPCHSKSRRGLLASFGVFLALAQLGCGRGVAEVSGKVRFKDQPLSSGTVTFVRQDGQSSSSAIAADGSYLIDEAPIGPVKIAVESHPRVPPGLMNPPGRAIPPPQAPKNHSMTIPERYRDPERSGLTHTVKRGSHTHDIDLTP
jgi:hypothetical protein